MAVFCQLDPGNSQVMADKREMFTDGAVSCRILKPLCLFIVFALQYKSLAQKQTDGVGDLLLLFKSSKSSKGSMIWYFLSNASVLRISVGAGWRLNKR